MTNWTNIKAVQPMRDIARHSFKPFSIRAQRGVSLIIVLIALMLMSVAAVALVRVVDTGTLVMGNIAFKQGTISAADRAVESAITWLQSATSPNADDTTAGYYAAAYTALDVTGKSTLTTRVLADWDGDGCGYAPSGSFSSCIATSAANSANGYTTRYLITRMCKEVGAINAGTNSCLRPVASTGGDSPTRGDGDYSNPSRGSKPAGPYYRIVVRSVGPRNSVSYTETYVHF